MKQFSLCLTLPTRSINNSLVILPGWPEEWSRHEEERRLGFLGQGSRQWDEGARADDLEEENDEDEDEEDELSDGMREDTDALMHEDELAEDEEYSAPTSASSVATYPNTVPFLHPPRIPLLSNTSSLSLELPTTSRRTNSFRAHDRIPDSTSRERYTRRSFSSVSQTQSQPPIQYVTSRSPSHKPSSSPRRIIESPRRTPRRKTRDEPRLLISNNDQTVKLFSLRSVTPVKPPSDIKRDPRLWDARVSRNDTDSPTSTSAQLSGHSGRIPEGRTQLDASLSRSRSGTGSDAVGLNGGLAAVERSHDAIRWDLDRARQEREILLQHRQVLNRMLVRERQGLDMERAELDEFERVIGLSIRPRPSSSASSARPREGPSCPPVMPTPQKQEMREERKLTKVGGARFKYAINHCTCQILEAREQTPSDLCSVIVA